MDKSIELKYALDYLALGFSFVPGKYKEKGTEANWMQYQKNLPTPATVQFWFGGSREQNICLIMGKVSGNAVAIDFDEESAYKEWAAEYPEIAKTATSKTAKGYHVIIRIKENLPGCPKAYYKDKAIGEIKGEGGMINVAPSVHPSGHEYMWINDPEDVTAVDNLDSIGIKAGKSKRNLKKLTEKMESVAPSNPYIETVLSTQLERLRNATEGDRNNTLFQVAATLGEYIAGGELSDDIVLDKLYAIAVEIGLEKREIESTIKSGLERGEENPKTAPKLKIASGEFHIANYWDTVIEYALSGSDAEDAKLLADMYEGQLTYDHIDNAWYVFNGVYWEADIHKQVYKTIESLKSTYAEVVGEYAATLSLYPDNKDLKDQLSALRKRVRGLSRKTKIRDVLDLAQAELPFTKVWDNHSMLLGVRNGVIDLKTGEFSEGRPDDYIRTIAPIEWKGIDEPAPIWEQFIDGIMGNDKELVDFLQRYLGYSITGEVSEHKFPILWGEGRNGKSTLLETIRHILGGKLCLSTKAEVVMESGPFTNKDPYMAQLQGRRLVWASETDRGINLSVGLVKMATGGDSITTRELFKNPVTFTPTHKLFLMTNNRPHIPHDDTAIWDRVLLIEFGQRFVDNPQFENEYKCDKDLDKKLRNEASGILAWLVRGCLAWQKCGLNPPKKVLVDTEEYRNEEDVVGMFVEECLSVDKNGIESISTTYKAFEKWADTEGYRTDITKRNFTSELGRVFRRQGAYFTTKQKTRDGNTQKCYFGFRVQPELLDGDDIVSGAKQTLKRLADKTVRH